MSKSRTFELKLFPVPECKWTADAARQWLREGREGFEEILREGFAKGKTDAILDPLWAHWHLSGDVATMTAAALAVIEDGVRVTFERRFPESHVDALGDLGHDRRGDGAAGRARVEARGRGRRDARRVRAVDAG